VVEGIMKDILVFVKRDFFVKFKDDPVGFFEWIAKLEGIFGNFKRLKAFKPFSDHDVVTGAELVGSNIPKDLGMVLRLKKFCLTYGAENFYFTEPESDTFPEKDYINWTFEREKLMHDFLRRI